MDIYHPYTIALLHHSFAMSEGTLVGLHRLILITVPIAEPVPVPGYRGGCIGRRVYGIGGCRRCAVHIDTQLSSATLQFYRCWAARPRPVPGYCIFASHHIA